MSETRKIIVEIVSPGGKGNGNKSDNTARNGDKTNRKEATLLGKAVLVERAFYKTIQSSKRLANVTIGRINTLSEDYIGQTVYNNVASTINDGLSAVYMLASFSTIGTMLGGAALGSGLGVVAAIGGKAVQVMQQYQQYYSNLNAASYNTSYSRIRAGLSDSSRGTEN